jgi:polyhydroxyalkanoate synthesis repressor PhaR
VAKHAKPKTAPKTQKDAAPKRRRGRPPKRETDTPEIPGVRVIKRYGNRRLYDHTLSRAVTMEQLAGAVRRGEDFRVFDGESGNDVTRRVLLQIVLEQQNEAQLDLLPIDFLRQLIQLRSEPLGEWIRQYLEAGAEWLERNVAGVSGPALRNMQQSMESLFPWMRTTGNAASATPPPPSNDDKAGRDLADEIDRLQSRLADLAKRVIRR